MSKTIVKSALALNAHWFMNKLQEEPLADLKTCYPSGNDFVFEYSVDVVQAHIDALDTFLSDHDENFVLSDTVPKGSDLVIDSVLDVTFKKYNFNSVDFKRHLKPPNALNKKVVRGVDGRPEKAEYFIRDSEGVETLACTINFYFILDANGLMSRRSEHLSYELKAGGKTGPAVIKDKFYDLATPSDMAIVINERKQGRNAIIDEIKAVLLGTLSAANPSFTTEQVLALGVPFWDEQEENVQHFTELGTSDFKDSVAAIDLGTTAHDWLNEEVQPGLNLRDYLVAKLTYTATSNHPDA